MEKTNVNAKSDLRLSAISAMENSYSPYSNFKVGAALLCSDGSIYCGTNIENASYSVTLCAERSAFAKAIGDGKKDFVAIAICGGKNGEIDGQCPPCGVCLQFMSEFCKSDFLVYLITKDGLKSYKLKELLPNSFSLKD